MDDTEYNRLKSMAQVYKEIWHAILLRRYYMNDAVLYCKIWSDLNTTLFTMSVTSIILMQINPIPPKLHEKITFIYLFVITIQYRKVFS